MRIQRIGLLVIVCILISSLAHAEEVGELSNYFKPKDMSVRLSQIKGALKSFRGLTVLIHKNSNLKKDYKVTVMDERKIPKNAKIKVNLMGKDVVGVGNLAWEIQNIGFENWPKYIEGYIEYLDLKNIKLELELALYKKEPLDVIIKLQKKVKKKEKSIRDKYILQKEWVD